MVSVKLKFWMFEEKQIRKCLKSRLIHLPHFLPLIKSKFFTFFPDFNAGKAVVPRKCPGDPAETVHMPNRSYYLITVHFYSENAPRIHVLIIDLTWWVHCTQYLSLQWQSLKAERQEDLFYSFPIKKVLGKWQGILGEKNNCFNPFYPPLKALD